MLTFNELIGLKEKLANGTIAIDLAKELYWKDYKEENRSWHTKDWKERRAKVIKAKCEICTSQETLTIQHLSHPKNYSVHKNEVTKQHAKSFIESNTILDKFEFSQYITMKYDYVPVPLCPKCESRHPNKRMRKTPQYLCIDCRHEFDVPINKSIDELIETFYKNEEADEVRDKCFVSKNWKKQCNLSGVKYWLKRERTTTKNAEIIEKEAFLLFLDENIKYLSFEDTITACKKCASNYDLNYMELCPKCKECYKGIQYSTCVPCLPEEKRKAALEKIEFGKEWQAMHERAGLD